MNAATIPGPEFIYLPSLDPTRARALFPVLIEGLMKMELSDEQAAIFFRKLMEPLLNILGRPDSDQAGDTSWKQWFDFCESFHPVVPMRSYQDILDDDDRR